MILAGNTFNLVQESLKQCISFNFGTILVSCCLLLDISRLYKSLMLSHPNELFPDRWNAFIPPNFEENRALIIFFNYNNVIILTRVPINTLCIYLVCWTNHPINFVRWMKWIKHPRCYLQLILGTFVVGISTYMPMCGFDCSQIGRSPIAYKKTGFETMNF